MRWVYVTLIGLSQCGLDRPAPSIPDIPIAHTWDAPPTIVICDGVDEDRWRKAAKATARHGARWANVIRRGCYGLPADGEVWVGPMPEDEDDGNAGLTYVNYDAGRPSWALSAVRADAMDTWAPEHELLHAQGLMHHTMTQHVMTASLDVGGRRWDGVRAAMRRAWDGVE